MMRCNIPEIDNVYTDYYKECENIRDEVYKKYDYCPDDMQIPEAEDEIQYLIRQAHRRMKKKLQFASAAAAATAGAPL